MAMNDTHDLAVAIVTGENIQLEFATGETIEAEVLSAVFSCDHSTGQFCGSVNYRIKGRNYADVDAFYNMWKRGWRAVR